MRHFSASTEWQVNLHQNTGLNSLKKMLFTLSFILLSKLYIIMSYAFCYVYGIGISLPNQPVTR